MIDGEEVMVKMQDFTLHEMGAGNPGGFWAEK